MSCANLRLAFGPMLFWKTNDPAHISSTMKTNGRNICISEIPADLSAVSSLLSPKLPNVISDASRMASGKALGTKVSPAYQKNCAMTSSDKPLPISVSTKRHRNCIISTNWQMKKAPANSTPNCLAINICSFFGLRFISGRCRAGGTNRLQSYTLLLLLLCRPSDFSGEFKYLDVFLQVWRKMSTFATAIQNCGLMAR